MSRLPHWYQVLASILCLFVLSPFTLAQEQQVELTIRNRSTTSIKIYWVDPQNKEIPYGTVEPGKEVVQATFAGHNWVFRSGAKNEIIQRHTAQVDGSIDLGVPTSRAAMPLPTQASVKGTDLVSVEKHVGQTLMGYFRETATGTWREESAIDAGRRDWKEVRRDANSVVLQSTTELIRLDLAAGRIFYSVDDFKTEVALYELLKPQPRAASSALPAVPARTPEGTPAPNSPTPNSPAQPLPPAVPAPSVPTAVNEPVTGLNMTYAEMFSETGNLMSRLKQTGIKKWLDEGVGGKRELEEFSRDANKVVLKRFNLQGNADLVITINLATKKVFVGNAFIGNDFELRNVKALPLSVAAPVLTPPVVVTSKNLGSVESLRGGQLLSRFRQIGITAWIEEMPGTDQRRSWTESRRDDSVVELRSEGESVRIDLGKRQLLRSANNFQTITVTDQVQNGRAVAVLVVEGALTTSQRTGADNFVGKITNKGGGTSEAGEFKFYFEQKPEGRIYGTMIVPPLAPNETFPVGQASEYLSGRFAFDKPPAETTLFLRIERTQVPIAQLEFPRNSRFAIVNPSNPQVPTLPNEKATKVWADYDLLQRATHKATIAVDGVNQRDAVPYDLHIFKLMAGGRHEFRIDTDQNRSAYLIIEDAAGNTLVKRTTVGSFSPKVTGVYRVLVFAGSPTSLAYTLEMTHRFRSELRSNESLVVGEYLKSEDGRFTGRLEEDGRFTIRKYTDIAWQAPGLSGAAPYRAILSDSGIFACQSKGKGDIYSSHYETSINPKIGEQLTKSGSNKWRIKLLNAGNLAIYCDGPAGLCTAAWFSEGKNVDGTNADYPKDLCPPDELGDEAYNNLRAAPAALNVAARAALLAVYDYKEDSEKVKHKNEIVRFHTHAEPNFPDIGLGPTCRVSFYRKVGDREMTFLVASNETDVVVAIRGTETLTNWNLNGIPFNKASVGDVAADGDALRWSGAQLLCLTNALPILTSNFPGLLVHQGWNKATDSIFPLVCDELVNHRAQGKSITITGHSLGGAVTGYLTYRLMHQTDFFDPQRPHLMATFAAPRYALEFHNGAPAVAAFATALGIFDLPQDLANATQAFFKEVGNHLKAVRPDLIISDIQQLQNRFANRLAFTNNNPYEGNFLISFNELHARKAPKMDCFSIEAHNGNRVDAITAAWSLQGWGEQIIETIRGPLAEIEKYSTIELPAEVAALTRLPRRILLLGRATVTFIPQLTALGQQGFGSALRLGIPINIPSKRDPVMDLHESRNYLNVLEASGQLKTSEE